MSSAQNEYAEGEEVTVTATPDGGYYFTAWYENGQPVSENPVYTFEMPSRDMVLRASFSEIPDEPVILGNYPVAVGSHFTVLITAGSGVSE